VILNDLDAGWRPARMLVAAGQNVGRNNVQGGRALAWSQGQNSTSQDMHAWLVAWNAIGGQNALTLPALRLVRQQLRELADNPDMQPVYLQLAATAQPGYPSRADMNDGWYYISAFGYDPETHVFNGAMEVDITVIDAGSSSPTSLKMLYEGAGLSTTYISTPVVLVALPFGGVGPVVSLSRTGAEGAVPLIAVPSGGVNPVPFIPSSTLANLWVGGTRCFDTAAAGGNAVPTGGAFTHASWYQIYGPDHNFSGDLVLTNGLLLLRFNQAGSIDVYVWNTQGTPGWLSLGTLQYQDNSANIGTVRSIDLERISLRSSRVTAILSTTGGNFARVSVELDAGHYEALVEFQPLTQAAALSNALQLNLATTVKVVANESAIVDIVTQAAASLAPTASTGWSVAISTTANQPLVGWLYQNAPDSGQPRASGTSTIGFGETTGPAQGTFRTYGLFAVPYITAPNLLAEAESGTLGTGWTSTADAGSSGGNAAKCASGTASTNADLWATAFVPAAGVYDLWVRLRLASLASSTSQMQIGLWNSTDSVFVASTTYAPNAAALAGGTSYIWVKVASAVTPTATKNMRVRAVATATTTTDWFIDQSALVPVRAATLGQGSFPADIWAQFIGRRRLQLVAGL
jgi:hypothetical protein